MTEFSQRFVSGVAAVVSLWALLLSWQLGQWVAVAFCLLLLIVHLSYATGVFPVPASRNRSRS